MADSWNIPRKELLEVFIRAVNFGICDMQWDFHCPRCGGIARESLKLIETKSEDYCPACKIDFENTLDEKIEVKIGLHSGPTLVVTLNNMLDYFGSTVNIAARIQSASKPNQIVFSESIYNNNKKTLLKYINKITKKSINLKGLSENFNIFHVSCSIETCKY